MGFGLYFSVILSLSKDLFPSFPNFIWERACRGNFIADPDAVILVPISAKWNFAKNKGRSQITFGYEERPRQGARTCSNGARRKAVCLLKKLVILSLSKDLFPSFPNFIWERACRGNFIADPDAVILVPISAK